MPSSAFGENAAIRKGKAKTKHSTKTHKDVCATNRINYLTSHNKRCIILDLTGNIAISAIGIAANFCFLRSGYALPPKAKIRKTNAVENLSDAIPQYFSGD